MCRIKSFIGIMISLFVVMGTALNSWAERKPLKKPERQPVIVAKTLEERLIGINPKTGEQIYETDYHPEIAFDKETGDYFYRWKGAKGESFTMKLEPTTKIDIVVIGNIVEIDKNKFRYSYSLNNLKTSKQRLWVFLLETKEPVNNITKPDKGWDATNLLLRHYGLGISGINWGNSLHDIYGTKTVEPGQLVRGFSFVTEGLPDIVKCFAKGYAPGPKVPDGAGGVPEEVGESIHEFCTKFQLVSGKTIGPVAISDSFIAEEFVENIISLLAQSFELGWIEQKKIYEDIEGKLGLIKNAVVQNNTVEAKKLLSALLGYIESEKDALLLPEAYALLKFNTQYLLNHL